MSGMKVVGITKGISKTTKKTYTVLHVVGEFDDYLKKDSKGLRAENVYIAREVYCDVDDVVEMVYGVGFKGLAVVTDVNVIA